MFIIRSGCDRVQEFAIFSARLAHFQQIRSSAGGFTCLKSQSFWPVWPIVALFTIAKQLWLYWDVLLIIYQLLSNQLRVILASLAQLLRFTQRITVGSLEKQVRATVSIVQTLLHEESWLVDVHFACKPVKSSPLDHLNACIPRCRTKPLPTRPTDVPCLPTISVCWTARQQPDTFQHMHYLSV